MIIKEVGEETEKGGKDGEIEGDQSTLAIVQGWLHEVAELADMDSRIKRRAKDALMRRLELK